jgi:ABC-type transporter Mla subunit MlaD
MTEIDTVLKFILDVPLAQNEIFPYAIYGLLWISLVVVIILNYLKIEEYKKDMNNLIYDDYVDGVSLSFIPGILMSMGIIGTFYLIYTSLSHFNIEDMKNVSEIITTKIAPAFSISALGIVASIFYTFSEKLLMFIYGQSFKQLKVNHTIRAYSDFATEELKTSKEILEAILLQSETFEKLSNFSDSLNEASKGMSEFGEIALLLKETLNPKELGLVISNALSEKMNPALENIEKITSNVADNSQKITKFLEEDLKNDVIEPLLKSVKSTDDSTKEMKEVLEKTSQMMAQTNQGFDKILVNLNTIQESQDSFVNNLKETLVEQRDLINDASNKLQSTLDGVDNSLIKTSETITEKLTEFRDSYTDTLKGFLDKQADELHSVFGEHTEKLKEVVVGFKETLESDVDKRKILNEDLDKLIATTDGFVSSTQLMITTAFDEQQKQLSVFMQNNQSMQSKLTCIIDNASDINDKGNSLTKELIDTTADLQVQFNEKQVEVLDTYRKEVDNHLETILGGIEHTAGAMLEVIEEVHRAKSN